MVTRKLFPVKLEIIGKSLPGKEDFYSNLNMEEIADADYAHVKRICKYFKIKTLEEYHDLFKVMHYC